MASNAILKWKNIDGLCCADGSAAGYFTTPDAIWRQFPSRNVVIFLEGRGWAYTVDDFVRRAKEIKSNKAWYTNQEMTPYGILKTLLYGESGKVSCNAVYVPNYDFTSLSGTAGKTEVFTSDGEPYTLYFDGHKILRRIIEEVREKLQLKPGLRVIVSGRSAGGTTVLCNIDMISDMLKGVQTYGVPDSGFFLYLPTAKDATRYVWPDQMRQMATLAKSAFPPAVCEAVQEKLGVDYEEYKCFFPEYFAGTIKTPMFIAQSLYDTSEIDYTLLLPPYDKLSTYDADEWEAFQKLYGQHREAMKPLLDVTTTGAFLINMPIHKVLSNWNYQIDGYSVQKALGEWLGDGEHKIQLIDAPHPSDRRVRKIKKHSSCCIQ